MAAAWYAVLVGILLFLLGILFFGTTTIGGSLYAWLFVLLGILGLSLGLTSERPGK